MASTERSLGWATSGTGDGPAGGYDSTRWRANAQKSDGTGITLFGSYMAMSGTTTSTLTIGSATGTAYPVELGGNTTTRAVTIDASNNLILQSSATPATLTVNGQLTVNATSNTNLRFSYRGSDGTTRVADITLA